ncbi:hypothetical protein [Qipengyuania flava]|uniref:hypothetical protein n=1 Tax=Qipengyuania flava TaxID=192812 RepID=UPI00273EB9D7|nr:hypothetical protein [Qipengyuania flava]
MTTHTPKHPRVLSSLRIVRDRPFSDYESAIRSVAILNLECSDEGPRFSQAHAIFDRTESRADILRGIVERVPASATLITRRAYCVDPARPNADHFRPSDIQLIKAARRDLDINLINCLDDDLLQVAAAFALRLAGPGSSLATQIHCAPADAQVLWLAFLWTQFEQADRSSLSSAFEAWRVIELARQPHA